MAASLLRLSRTYRELLPPPPALHPAAARPCPHLHHQPPPVLPLLPRCCRCRRGTIVALCDPGVYHRVGGKDSTELVVKGEHRRVPREFIDELASFLGDNLTVDYEERSFHGTPQNSFHKAPMT